jgi:hypothetical protein
MIGHQVMIKRYLVNAEWDADASVWVATSDDVPGLVTESDTLEALQSKVQIMVPELLRPMAACQPTRSSRSSC